MEAMTITVLSARWVGGEIRAWIRADSRPRARLHIQLRFPAQKGRKPWEAAYDEALRYLDVS